MKYINDSLEKYLIKENWHLGDYAARIGHPFTWADTGAKPLIVGLDHINSLLHFFCMYYVEKKTPKYIKTKKEKSYKKKINQEFTILWNIFFKYLNINNHSKYISAQAQARTQDLCFIKKYTNLKKNINYLDVGPGIGGMYPTLSTEYNLRYYGVEAIPMTYFVQKLFLQAYCTKFNDLQILDVCELESYFSKLEINKKIKNSKISLIPSWHFDLIKNQSIDLASAMFMMNELTYPGVFWVLSKTISKLKLGGYFYIRDSNILKPGCHNINYDQVLKDFGFKEIAYYRIDNRLDFYGIPRVYKKEKNIDISFDILTKKYLGKYTSVASGAERSYNWKTQKKK